MVSSCAIPGPSTTVTHKCEGNYNKIATNVKWNNRKRIAIGSNTGAEREVSHVSTSEAAKQLLESSKEERPELVNLLIEPTDSL